MRYVLFITYYFPPAGGPGVQRVLKFIKYLRDFGWTPIVLVPENPEYQALDTSLINELPADLIIRRAPIFEPYDLYRKFTGKPKGVSLDVNVIKEEGAKRSVTERIAELVRATFFIPDARIGWYWSAVREGRKILEEYPIDMIYSSSPPYTPALIARKLKRISNRGPRRPLPWVAGFRDPWTGFHNTPNRWFLPKRIDRALEHSVFSEADIVEVAWKGIMEDALTKYPDLRTPRQERMTDRAPRHTKFVHIPNGFDSADFPEPDIRKRGIMPINEKCTITYSGSLYGPRNPLSFLRAIEMLIERKEIDPANMKLRFVGRFGAEIHEMLARPMIEPMIEKMEYVPHARAVELLLDSDALLLIVDEVPSVQHIVPGKVYEYMGAMRPLIAIAPPNGAIGELLRETNAGDAIEQSDIEGQARVIAKHYRAWQQRDADPRGADPRGAAPRGAARPARNPVQSAPRGADPRGADPRGADPRGAARPARNPLQSPDPSSVSDAQIAAIEQYERREATHKLAKLFDELTNPNNNTPLSLPRACPEPVEGRGAGPMSDHGGEVDHDPPRRARQ